MKRTILATTILALSVPGLAQDKRVTSPSGYESRAGEQYSDVNICSYENGHFQLADANFKARGAKTIKQIAFRHDDNRSYAPTSGMGRRWSRVTLRMSDCSYGILTNTFSRNSLGPRTTIYRRQLTVATKTGTSGPGPQPFTAVLIPFDSSWFYSARNDLLTDITLEGGTLENGAPWGQTGGIPDARPYYLDAVLPGINVGVTTTYGSYDCRDSSMGGSGHAWCYPTVLTYSKNMGSPSTSNKMYFESLSIGTAKGAAVVHAIGLNGSPAGGTLPWATAPCNTLFLDLTGTSTVIYVAGRASSEGTYGTAQLFGFLPYAAGAVGSNVWTQAGWDDSKTGAFKLTRAGRATVPAQPPDPIRNRRKVVSHHSITSPTGTSPFSYYRHNAIYELTYQ